MVLCPYRPCLSETPGQPAPPCSSSHAQLAEEQQKAAYQEGSRSAAKMRASWAQALGLDEEEEGVDAPGNASKTRAAVAGQQHLQAAWQANVDAWVQTDAQGHAGMLRSMQGMTNERTQRVLSLLM
eukprot:scaffold35187_cov17-Tisochrysis_lutea.AAC.1